MNKLFFTFTAVLAASAVFFAACQDPVTNPSSITNVDGFNEISGPEWVKATAYPGAIFVAWAFNKDAKTYSVYRQRADGRDQLTRLETPARPMIKRLPLISVSPTLMS
jgi:hypothetical protein